MTTFSSKKISVFAACAAMMTSVVSIQSAGAQSSATKAAVPVARFSVDIKDATLMDALRLVFVAAGVGDYNIDPAAKAVRVGSLSFKNQPWRDIVRSLASLNKFRFAREGSLWVVQPRMTMTSGEAVFNSSTRISAKKSPVDDAFSMVTRASAQFGGSGSSSGSSGSSGATSVTVLPRPTANQSNNPWTIIEPNHTYAGALALFFQGAVVFTTEEQVIPGSWSRGLLASDDLTEKDNGNNNSSGNSNSNNNNNR